MELCLTLASLLGGSGWERLRISTVEDDWESSVLMVPKELREGLTALGAAHLRAVRRTN
jgi:ABC-type phosphate transport system permease subunit